MDTRRYSCMIAVDGGGTTCRMALVMPADGAGQRYDLTLGPANTATDLPRAIATVQQGVRQLGEQAGLEAEKLSLSRLHAALAGIRTRADSQLVAGELKQRLGMAHVTVSDDQVSTVRGALGTCDGTVVGVGTGSFLARQTAGQMRFVGGWGLVLGDQASGAWLGRELLSAVLRAVDGLAQRSPICEAMLERFSDPQGISTFAASAGPAEFAALAPLVVRCAQDGDHVAQRLMRRGGEYIEQGLTALGHNGGDRVVLTGGLAAPFAAWLPDKIRVGLCAPKGTALDGALFLAAQSETGL